MEQKQLDHAAIEARREYYRRWRAANKERVKRHNANYWAKKAAEAEQSSKERDGQ